MSEEKKERIAGWVFWTTLTISIGLIIGGFLTPPMAVIDGSVLTAVGEMFAFAALGVGLEAVRLGRNLRLSKGDLVAEITRKKQHPQPLPYEEPVAEELDNNENLD